MALAAVTGAVALVLFVAYKHFLFTTFDGDVAQFYGVPTGWVEAMFSLVLAGTIVVSLQVLGVLLIAGATVIPPVSARMLTDSFPRMLVLSAAIGAVCGLSGHIPELLRRRVVRGYYSPGRSLGVCLCDGLHQPPLPGLAAIRQRETHTHRPLIPPIQAWRVPPIPSRLRGIDSASPARTDRVKEDSPGIPAGAVKSSGCKKGDRSTLRSARSGCP